MALELFLFLCFVLAIKISNFSLQCCLNFLRCPCIFGCVINCCNEEPGIVGKLFGKTDQWPQKRVCRLCAEWWAAHSEGQQVAPGRPLRGSPSAILLIHNSSSSKTQLAASALPSGEPPMALHARQREQAVSGHICRELQRHPGAVFL